MPNINADSLNNPGVNFENRSTDHAAPGSGRAMLYIKNGSVYVRLDTGDPVAVGGVVTLAEGQLAVGDGSDLLSALALGTEGYVVTADASGKAVWAEAPSATGGGWTLIASHTTGVGGEASHTFSDIPGSYKALRLIWRLSKTSTSAYSDALKCILNGDTGNHYYGFNTGSGPYNAPSVPVAGAYAVLGFLQGATNNPPSWSVGAAQWDDYAGGARGRFAQTESYSYSATDGTTHGHSIIANYWSETSAITSIALSCYGGGNFPEGAYFALYGIA